MRRGYALALATKITCVVQVVFFCTTVLVFPVGIFIKGKVPRPSSSFDPNLKGQILQVYLDMLRRRRLQFTATDEEDPYTEKHATRLATVK